MLAIKQMMEFIGDKNFDKFWRLKFPGVTGQVFEDGETKLQMIIIELVRRGIGKGLP